MIPTNIPIGREITVEETAYNELNAAIAAGFVSHVGVFDSLYLMGQSIILASGWYPFGFSYDARVLLIHVSRDSGLGTGGDLKRYWWYEQDGAIVQEAVP